MQKLIGVLVAVATAGIVTATAHAQPTEPGGDATTADDSGMAVEWSPYTAPEPNHVGSDPNVARQISQDFTEPSETTRLSWNGAEPAAVWFQQRISGTWGEWKLVSRRDGSIDSNDNEFEPGRTGTIVLGESDGFRFLVEGPIDDASVLVEESPTTSEQPPVTEPLVPAPSDDVSDRVPAEPQSDEGPAPAPSGDDERVAPASDDPDVAVEWSPYLASEPPHAGPGREARLISQDFRVPALMTGLSWGGGDPVAVWLQQEIDGTWGEWELLTDEHGDEHGVSAEGEGAKNAGDSEGERERPGTDAIVLGEPDAFRFVVEGPIEDARAFVYVDDSSATGTLPDVRALEPIASDDFEPLWPGPSFVRDRSTWDTGNCRIPDADFNLSSSRAVIVHHSAGSSNYSQSQVPAVLRGLCAYQTGARELDDVGYNFVVDRFGTVWEGRTGSKRAPIQSAHARGFNYNTQGVVLLGNYDGGSPPSAQVAGLRSILNWLTGWYGIDPDGRVTLVAGSDGAGFVEGDTRRVDGVAAHREVGQTSCPGTAFYPSLNGIADATRPTNFGTDADDPLGAYSTSTGFARFADPDSNGAGRLIADYDFLAGRTSIVDVDLDGDGTDELLYYNWSDGQARFADPNSTGAGRLIADYDFRPGWTSIADVDLDGDGGDEILYYQSSTGFARFVNPNASGSGSIIRDYSFRTGWTNVTGVDLDGDGGDEIFYYNSATGFARFVNPNASGSGSIIDDYDFRTGWTTITGVDLDGDGADELLYYNATTGYTRFINPNTTGAGSVIRDYNFRTGWTSITGVDLTGDGQDEIFYYK